MGQEQKGFTLVEVIIAIAIASIIVGAVTVFFSMGSKSYRAARQELNIQMESQIVMNQISDLVMKCDGVKVEETTDALTVTLFQNETGQTGLSQVTARQYLYYVPSNKKLYLFEDTPSSPVTPTASKEHLMGEYLESFSVNTSELDKSACVTISMKMKSGDRQYQMDKKIKLRNGQR